MAPPPARQDKPSAPPAVNPSVLAAQQAEDMQAWQGRKAAAKEHPDLKQYFR